MGEKPLEVHGERRVLDSLEQVEGEDDLVRPLARELRPNERDARFVLERDSVRSRVRRARAFTRAFRYSRKTKRAAAAQPAKFSSMSPAKGAAVAREGRLKRIMSAAATAMAMGVTMTSTPIWAASRSRRGRGW
jgi:hypothetical protein